MCVCLSHWCRRMRLVSFGLEKNVWVTSKGLSDKVMWLNKRFNLT